MSHISAEIAQGENNDNPYIHGVYGPIDDEKTWSTREGASPQPLEVIGEIPRDLHGAYVRNGPNPRFAPRGRYHWFDGDGMIHAVHFADGHLTYRNRWVRTAGLATEEQAGEAQWTGLLHSTRENPKGAPYKDTANTDVYLFGGELLASWYICGQPYRIDPLSLQTLGIHDFATGKAMRISAHGKVDPATGELYYFHYGHKPVLGYGVVGADGALAHNIEIPVPGPRLPHDMAITENHAILMDLPVFKPTDKSATDRWRTRFHHDVPARFAVLPRRGDASSVRWFEAEPCYIYHVVNAWEEDDAIVMVACRTVDPFPEPNPQRDGAWARPMANLRLHARLHRWRFDLKTGATHEEVIDDRSSEFPVINTGRIGRPTRYSYQVTIPDAPTLVFDGLIKYDTTSGAAKSHKFGPGRMGSEPAFAPRHGATGAGPTADSEDDGYVITLVTDERENRSEILVLDAGNMGGEPVARVLIPQRIPAGFHGCWVPGSQLHDRASS